MRRALLLACALGLSAPAAFAECVGHKVNAAVDVDTMTTASVTTTEKQSRLPQNEETVVLEKQQPAITAE